jgi:predicted nucleic acid-binding protein
MNEKSFLDTNVLIYTDDQDSPAKQTRALELFARLRRSNQGMISTQVLQEYFVAATRKLKVSLSVARRKVELFSQLPLVQIDRELILAAIDLRDKYQFSFWDALIVAAALQSHCEILLTEDLQAGQEIEGKLKIVNPFSG